MGQTYISYFTGYDTFQIVKFVEAYFDTTNWMFNCVKKTDLILIKPNLVVPACPDRYITTHPAVIEAIIICLLRKGYKHIGIGDSGITIENTKFIICGMVRLCQEYGCKIYDFDREKKMIVENQNNKWLKRIPVAECILKAKLIINVPKAKTHQGFLFTGAIKNLYGIIYGDLKREIHKIAHERDVFEDILIDIWKTFLPSINIMDSIGVLEGNGPVSGTQKKLDMILIGDSALELDIAFLKKMGKSTNEVGYLLKGFEREVKLVENTIDLCAEKKLSWQWPNSRENSNPVIIASKCIKCSACKTVCPAKAISFESSSYIINLDKCIRCYCCTEACRIGAIARR